MLHTADTGASIRVIRASLPNHPCHKNALQSAEPKRIQFCSGCDRLDSASDLCHDDEHRHREGEVDGHDGDFACLPLASHRHRGGKVGALLRHLLHEFCHHPLALRLLAQHPDSRQRSWLHRHLLIIYIGVAAIGLVYLQLRKQSVGSHVAVPLAHRSHGLSLRPRLPYREYARRIAESLPLHPSEMARGSGKKTDDTGSGNEIRDV